MSQYVPPVKCGLDRRARYIKNFYRFFIANFTNYNDYREFVMFVITDMLKNIEIAAWCCGFLFILFVLLLGQF